MKKLLSFITIMFFIVHFTFSEAPELKNMMPNSWQKLTRLSEQEENEFFIQQQVMHDIENVKSESWASPKYNIVEKRVYKENVNSIGVYRVLTCNQQMSDFLEAEYNNKIMSEDEYEKFRTQRIQQTIYVKQSHKSLSKIRSFEYRVYGIAEGNMEEEGCEYFIFNDVFIKVLNKKEIGFFITEANIGYQRKNNDSNCVLTFYKVKNQLRGANSCEFLRVDNKEDIAKVFSDSNRRVRISASNYLFDSKCPLKYSIQNAFDGNPATSYVENTEDDLMKIDVWLGKAVDKMAIINGYAASEDLYKANNRIKQVSNYFNLNDDCLSYQYILCRGTNVSFTANYKGLKFNDTCIAEINYLLNNKWIFGDINE